MCRRFAEIGGRVCEVLINVAVVLVCSVAHSTIQLLEKGRLRQVATVKYNCSKGMN